MIPVVLALLAAIFFAPALFFGQMPLYRDFVNTFLPYKLYAARAISAGRLPLWAPEPSLGAPFLANYQSGVLYPFSAIVYALPDATGVGFYLWLHFAVAAIGMAAFLGRRGLSPMARVFGAIVYTFGGTFVSIAPWSHLTVLAWLPASLVAAERLIERETPGRFAALVAVVALQLLGGAPEAFAQSAALTAAVVLVPAAPAGRARRLWLLAAALTLAIGIAAAQLLPTAEYFRESTRAAGLPPADALDNSLAPSMLSTLIFPNRLDGGIVALGAGGELTLLWSLYVGVAPLLLAAVGVGRREAAWWRAALAVALVLALGKHTPVYPFLYDHLPLVFASFRSPQKLFLTAHVALAVLAATGFAWLEQRVAALGDPRRALVAVGLCIVTIADLWDVHAPALLFTEWQSIVRSAPPSPLRDAGPEARIFAYEPAGFGLVPWVPRFRAGSDLRDVMRFAWSEMAANVALAYGIGFVNGRDSFRLPAHAELERELAAGPADRDERLLRGLGTRYWMGQEPLESESLELLRPGGPGRSWIYRTLVPAPRVYLARGLRRAAGSREALAIVGGEDFVPGEDAVVTGLTDDWRRSLAGGSARVLVDAPEHLVVEVESEGAGFLVVNDSFYPGWVADLDGQAAAILVTNGLVRGVEVPPGRHRASFTYAPRPFVIGCWMSLVSLLLLWPLARALSRRPR